MDSMPDRPMPARPLAEVVRAWLHWFGIARLVVICCAVMAVGAGAFWLLRAPTTPIEQTLPIASRATTTTSAASGAASSTSTATGSAATTTISGAASTVVVYVAGAVLRAGVVTLPATARVDDAIAAAGGLSPAADIDGLNLAAVLRDGDRVWVPAAGVPVPTVVLPQGGAPAASASSGSTTPAGPVDLNRATVDDLDGLPGVGPATAAAIIAYRDANGPFSSVDDLLDVRGIGPAKLDALRSLVTV
ncbi:MAG: comEA [Ilumatobacteraceae bacterium]|nr:comEA [Ilumatobacteraceae bacterium]